MVNLVMPQMEQMTFEVVCASNGYIRRVLLPEDKLLRGEHIRHIKALNITDLKQKIRAINER